MKAQKRPIVVEVRRWSLNDGDDGDSLGNDHMAEWLGPAFVYIDGRWLTFRAIDGRELVAHGGDYIVRQETPHGYDFWPVAPATFRETYEVIPEPAEGTP